MDRRLFLKAMGLAATGYVLPGFAAECFSPTAVPIDSCPKKMPLGTFASNLEDWGTNIKIVGVGGAGGNALEHMIREGLQNVEFVAINTDAQALARNPAAVKLTLGKTGLGAGAQPEAGRAAAEESRTAIRTLLSGAHMVFLTAGMGGGTGTGASPVIAEVAHEMGILTVGVVTKPFSFEGRKRQRTAEIGIMELSKHTDSLIVIPNDKLTDVLGGDACVDECFRAADDVLKHAAGAIADIITFPGLVGVDFEDVRTVMGEMGRAKMGSAVAVGSNRARIAAEQAMASPLMDEVNLSDARGVLVNITAAKGSLKMKEINEAMNTVRAFATDDAHIIFGAVYDEAMGDALRITVIGTGLGQPAARRLRSEVRRKRNVTVKALANSGVDRYDIPAFLRRPAG